MVPVPLRLTWLYHPGAKKKVIYQGLALSASENNVSFNKFPSISNPGNLLGPFHPGVLASTRARANSVLDANGSVAVITILSSGTDYQGTPGVEIFPTRRSQWFGGASLPCLCRS